MLQECGISSVQRQSRVQTELAAGAFQPESGRHVSCVEGYSAKIALQFGKTLDFHGL